MIRTLVRDSVLPRSFYGKSTVEIAKALIGTYLVHDTPRGRISGRIVETEAYLGDGTDPACHAHRGPTKRNQAMFGPAGTAYIYRIYGMYHCFNVVTQPEGYGEAVLVRALEPIEGIKFMEKHRGTTDHRALCSGPSKLVMALNITEKQNGHCLREGAVKILTRNSSSTNSSVEEIITTTRIGITKGAELPLRYYLAESPYISKKGSKIFSRERA